MSVRANSQCGRILAVLNDGRPHSVPEIHERAGTSRLNSRVSELRKQGYNVTCERLPGVKGAAGYVYRLTNPDRENGAYGRETTTRRFNALRDEHRGGRPWPEERFECNPDESAGLADPVDGNGFSLPWEKITPRDAANRFRIYCRSNDGDLTLIATCSSAEAVGVCIVTLGREHEFDDCAVGVLDVLGEKGERWVLRPWEASAKNASDAGKVLRRAQR